MIKSIERIFYMTLVVWCSSIVPTTVYAEYGPEWAFFILGAFMGLGNAARAYEIHEVKKSLKKDTPRGVRFSLGTFKKDCLKIVKSSP